MTEVQIAYLKAIAMMVSEEVRKQSVFTDARVSWKRFHPEKEYPNKNLIVDLETRKEEQMDGSFRKRTRDQKIPVFQAFASIDFFPLMNQAQLRIWLSSDLSFHEAKYTSPRYFNFYLLKGNTFTASNVPNSVRIYIQDTVRSLFLYSAYGQRFLPEYRFYQKNEEQTFEVGIREKNVFYVAACLSSVFRTLTCWTHCFVIHRDDSETRNHFTVLCNKDKIRLVLARLSIENNFVYFEISFDHNRYRWQRTKTWPYPEFLGLTLKDFAHQISDSYLSIHPEDRKSPLALITEENSDENE